MACATHLTIVHTHTKLLLKIVWLLSGKNWQDRDKADKLSISFLVTPKDN